MTSRSGAVSAAEERTTLRALLHSRTFVALLAADVQSVIGDQIARVALSVLVFERTGSATATALTYAATFVPAIVGGMAFSGLGDRYPRGPVMSGVALLRAALFAAMAIPVLDMPVVVALLVLAVLLGPVFGSTEVAFLSDALDEKQFAAANGVRLTANQLSQVAGFAVGGLVVAVLGPRPTLLLNAATFLVAAGLVGWAAHTARLPSMSAHRSTSTGLRAAAAWFAHHRLMLALLGLSALDGLFIVPEGLAVPFGHHVGAGTADVGILLAALPLGSALGAAVLVRFVPYRARPTAARWMAAGCGLPLVATALEPPWPVAFACWALTGALTAFQVVAITSVAQAAPDAQRAGIIGFGWAVVIAAQGLGLAAFGGLARYLSPGTAIAVAGLLGSMLATYIAVRPLAHWTVEVGRARSV
ncbi:MAG TPA: MFS transporter [Jatrophihabitans sp.]|nr:MFS transporter [Jatrophihabitans sp.]